MTPFLNRRRKNQTDQESGNSTVEFIGAAAGLLIPALLLIVAVVRVQSASFAAESAAAEVARSYSLARTTQSAQADAAVLANLAFSDHGLGAPDLSVSCASPGCQTPGDTVTVAVGFSVPLIAFGNTELGHYLVHATATSYLGQFVDRR